MLIIILFSDKAFQYTGGIADRINRNVEIFEHLVCQVSHFIVAGGLFLFICIKCVSLKYTHGNDMIPSSLTNP